MPTRIAVSLEQVDATLRRCATIDRAHLKLNVADLMLRKKYADARQCIMRGLYGVITNEEALELLSGIVNAELADKIVSIG